MEEQTKIQISLQAETIKPATSITDLETWKKQLATVNWYREELGIRYIGGGSR